MNKERPKHLDLSKIRLPLPGFVSITHRITGVLLFLILPLLLIMLQNSLRSVQTYTQLAEMLHHPLAKLVLFGVVWAAIQHTCSGIRFLMIDLDIGKRLAQARTSSKITFVASFIVTILAWVRLW